MLKKKITYVDYNGEEHTEDFYFNLNQAEVTEMEFTTRGGLVKKIQRIVDSQDQGEIIRTFKDIILRAYGKKSDDGLRFVKTPELMIEFSQTDAYNKLFMELLSDPDAAAAFINGIVPANTSANH